MTIFIVDELEIIKNVNKRKNSWKKTGKAVGGEDSCETGEIAFKIPLDRLIALNIFLFLFFEKFKYLQNISILIFSSFLAGKQNDEIYNKSRSVFTWYYSPWRIMIIILKIRWNLTISRKKTLSELNLCK